MKTYYEAICVLCGNSVQLCENCQTVVKPRSRYPDYPICNSDCVYEHLVVTTESCAFFLADKDGHYYYGCKPEEEPDTDPPPYEYGPCPRIWHVEWPPH